MRIITGSARGARLLTVSGDELVRPTAGHVKEAIFSAIQFDIEGRRILDLFAGSGQLGIEALSRGAQSATFVDSAEASISVVRQNLEHTRLAESAKVVKAEAVSFLSSCRDTFDIAFLDPPYKEGLLEKVLPLMDKVMSEAGIIICEHPVKVELPDEIGSFVKRKNYRYSKIAVTIFGKGGALN